MILRSLFSLLLVLNLAPAAHASERIIKGDPASQDYPFMAALSDPAGQFCGGTLIKPQWILTASHCLQGNPDISVRVGSRCHDEGYK